MTDFLQSAELSLIQLQNSTTSDFPFFFFFGLSLILLAMLKPLELEGLNDGFKIFYNISTILLHTTCNVKGL